MRLAGPSLPLCRRGFWGILDLQNRFSFVRKIGTEPDLLAGHGRNQAPSLFFCSLYMAVREAAFFQVLLMIVFGGPKRLGWGDFGHDGLGETLLRGIAGGLRFRLLLGRMEEDGAAVLRAYIGALAV